MKDNFKKKVWTNLVSLLIVGSCSVCSEINASTEQPKNFMNSEKVLPAQEEYLENLKQCIREIYKNLLGEHWILFLGSLSRPDKHSLLCLSVQYLLNHPEIKTSPIINTAYLNEYAKLDESYLMKRLIESAKREEEVVKSLELKKDQLNHLLTKYDTIDNSSELEMKRVIEIYSLEQWCVKDYVKGACQKIEQRLSMSRALLNLWRYIFEYNSIEQTIRRNTK